MTEGEVYKSRDIKAGVPHGSLLAAIIYSLYINDIHQTPGYTFIGTTDYKDGYVLRKLEHDLTSMESWCDR